MSHWRRSFGSQLGAVDCRKLAKSREKCSCFSDHFTTFVQSAHGLTRLLKKKNHDKIWETRKCCSDSWSRSDCRTGCEGKVVIRWPLTGRRLDDRKKNPRSVGDHLAITPSVGDHSMTTSRIFDFPSCSWNFRDHFEWFKNWWSRSRSSVIGHDCGMVPRPISATLLWPSGNQWWCWSQGGRNADGLQCDTAFMKWICRVRSSTLSQWCCCNSQNLIQCFCEKSIPASLYSWFKVLTKVCTFCCCFREWRIRSLNPVREDW